MPLMLKLNRVMHVPDSEIGIYLSNGYRLYMPEETERDNKKPDQQPIQETEAFQEAVAAEVERRMAEIPSQADFEAAVAAEVEHRMAEMQKPGDGGEDDPSPYAGMGVEELKAYATENDYDIGNATSINGIIKKIEEAKAAAGGGGAWATE